MKPLLIVVAPYYEALSATLVAGARAAIAKAGRNAEVIEVPGALEIPTAMAIAATSGSYAGYVALGAVLRGDTSHYDVVVNESARGLQELGTKKMLAIGNGILTCETMEQAELRADLAQGDKGGEAARAALRLIELRAEYGLDEA